MGFSLMCTGGKITATLLDLQPGKALEVPSSDAETLLFLGSAVGVMLLGLVWLLQAVLRSRAVTIDRTGVSGFTLLGTKHIAWPDVDRVEVAWHPVYKHQITIHAVVGSKTGGYGVTGIPIMTAKIDRAWKDILPEIQQYRPDVPVDVAKRNRLAELFQRYSEKVSEKI